MIRRLAPFLALAAIGAAWGATQPLAKLAVSEGYRHFGLLFWQLSIGAVLLGGVTVLRGRGLPFDRRSLPLYLIIALVGTVLPGVTSYTAAIHLPSGVLSILLSSVPLFTFPMALALGNDRFSVRRFLGLCLGMLGVAILVLPRASLPDPAMAAWIPVALISSAFYAAEGNYVARWGMRGLDPVQTLAGASVLGAAICLPLALATGQFIDLEQRNSRRQLGMEMNMTCNNAADYWYSHGATHIKCVLKPYYDQGPNTYAPGTYTMTPPFGPKPDGSGPRTYTHNL